MKKLTLQFAENGMKVIDSTDQNFLKVGNILNFGSEAFFKTASELGFIVEVLPQEKIPPVLPEPKQGLAVMGCTDSETPSFSKQYELSRTYDKMYSAQQAGKNWFTEIWEGLTSNSKMEMNWSNWKYQKY